MEIVIACTCHKKMKLDKNDVAVVDPEEIHFGSRYVCPDCGQTVVLADARQSLARRDIDPQKFESIVLSYPPERLLEVAE